MASAAPPRPHGLLSEHSRFDTHPLVVGARFVSTDPDGGENEPASADGGGAGLAHAHPNPGSALPHDRRDRGQALPVRVVEGEFLDSETASGKCVGQQGSAQATPAEECDFH